MSATKTLQERLEAERQRVFQAWAVVQLVIERLDGVSGDEDSLDLAELTSQLSHALEGANELLDTVASRLETIPKEEGRSD